jgi:hypothetical protein
MRAIITDIDHTVSDSFWRDEMIGNLGWDEYYEAGAKDSPLAEMVRLLSAMAHHEEGHLVVAVTARPRKWYHATMRWMVTHKIPVDEILMRPDDDHRPTPLVKVDLIRARFPDLSEVLFCLEDRDDCVAAMRSLGLTVLQVYAAGRVAKLARGHDGKILVG